MPNVVRKCPLIREIFKRDNAVMVAVVGKPNPKRNKLPFSRDAQLPSKCLFVHGAQLNTSE